MPPPFQSDTPFAVYAREHGFGKLTKLPGSTPKTLSARPEKIAPNSPALEELAAYMKVPLSELQEFAKAPPMGEKWVKKIRAQIDGGTLPKGKKLGRAVQAGWKRRGLPITKRPNGVKRGKYQTAGGLAKNPFTKLLAAEGWTLSKLADEIGLKPTVLWKLSMGNSAPNHPALAPIAEASGVPLGQLAGTQRGRRMSSGMVRRVSKQLGIALSDRESHDRKSGKGVVLHVGKPVLRGEESENGNGHRPTKGMKYNRLGSKRSDLQLRQSVRALISTLNVSVMRGDSHVPPIPVGDLYVILQDYVDEKGIKAGVLIDPEFGRLFDPR